jgi:NADH dehydrogenase
MGQPHIVIIGAGFGGLYAARALANHPVGVTLIDRHNFHTFSPLLYQVATCGLDPSGIAYPIRSIFRGANNIRFLLGEVSNIDTTERCVDINTESGSRRISYDHLILAAGSVTNFFGNSSLQAYGFGLKSLSDAVVLRNHILKLFEQAAWVSDPNLRNALTTLVVVGGGPTGLETAGALFELYQYILKEEYAKPPVAGPRVILIEAQNHLLDPFPSSLQDSALKQLQSLGVEVLLGALVGTVQENQVILKDGRVIPTHTLVWAAGVKASPLAEMLHVPLQRAGRVPVSNTLEVIGLQQVYVIGDMAYLEDETGKPYPMLIPVAKQQGLRVARNLLAQPSGRTVQPFTYRDRGIMATIGRSRAVAWIYYRVKMTGYLAWLAWLVLHLVWLLGFRNRLSVFVNWVWNYFTYDRSVRIILDQPKPRQSS